MTIRSRLVKLETASGAETPFKYLTDAELEERLAALIGLEKGEPITDAILAGIVEASKAWEMNGVQK